MTAGPRGPTAGPNEIVAHECHGTMRPYPPELCSVCTPSEPVGVMTLPELVTAFNALRAHRCGLPASIIEALNSGDGTYRP